jgi:small subunit ribosomal protein S3
MGQKVNPHGLRLGINKEWDSVWYAEKDFAKYLLEDHNIRRFIKKYFKDRKPVPVDPKIARITITRTTNRVKVTLHTASPGIIIGRNGEAIKTLTDAIQKLVDRNPSEYKADVEIQEIKRPELNSQLVAEVIAKDLENRVTFRRAMKQAMTRAMKNGAKGIKTAVSGRLGGADIARTESYHEGTIPLQTLRADIDYGFAEADTTYGKLGVKVWLYKGEVLPGQARQERSDRPFRERREGAGDYANAKKGKKTQAVSRSNDRKGSAR